MFQYKKEHTGWVVFVVGCKTKPSAWSASASTRCGPRWCLKYSSTLPQVFFNSSSYFSLHFFSFQIEDLVVKSILCGLTSLKEEMNTGQKKEVPFLLPESVCISSVTQVKSTYNMYKLLGYDILLDSHRRPHLIEVNARPACLHNPLDAFVNRPMVTSKQHESGWNYSLSPRLTRCSRSWATTSPWTASPTWKGRTPLAASSTFQMCQVRRRVFAFN